MKQDIIVVAQPRSGITWLNKLLGDALSSGLVAYDRDGIDPPLFFGPRQDGDYLIRKSHYAQSYNAPVVFLQRDPRDVAVSRMHYRKMTDLGAVIKTMHTYESWMQEMESHGWTVKTSYEMLHESPAGELDRIIAIVTGKIITWKWGHKVSERQHIDNVRKEHPHSVRKGIVGDWKNHFTCALGEQITELLGDFMLEQGYITGLDWWKELDE